MTENQDVLAFCLRSSVEIGASVCLWLLPKIMTEVEVIGRVVRRLNDGIGDRGSLHGKPCDHLSVLAPQLLPVGFFPVLTLLAV